MRWAMRFPRVKRCCSTRNCANPPALCRRTTARRRRRLQVRSNPAAATMQLLGVYDKKLVEPLAKVLGNLGVTRGVAVCGSDGLDEITVTGETTVCEIRFGETKTYTISPEQFGIKRCELSELIGGTPVENAQITREILTGKERGAKRNAVLLNAGMSLYLGIDGITLEEGVKMAADLIDSKKALAKLEEFVKVTKEV